MKEPSANEFAGGSPAADAPQGPRAPAQPAARAEPPPAAKTSTRSDRLAALRVPLMVGGVVVVAIAAAYVYFTGGRYQSTDDAYTQAAGVDISSNIAGRVVEVDVHENQLVKAGEVLFRLDPAPHDIAISQAEAQVADARQQMQAAIATWRQRQVDVKNAQDAAAFAERERRRDQELLKAGAVSQSEYDQAARQATNARLQIGTAQQQQAQALAALGGDPNQPIDSHAAVRQALAQLARAQLEKSWSFIRAPQDGRVTKVTQLQVGDYINAAAPVFHLVTGQPWIDANFKENQLTHMRVGQAVSVSIDAFKGHSCQGRVQSIAPATDQTFSLLPAQNATGNWVKVVQRLPVRIVFECNPQLDPPAGLSANVKVDTGYKRRLFGHSGPTR